MKRISLLIGIVVVLTLSVTRAGAITGGVRDEGAHPTVGIMGVFIEGEPVGFCSCTLIGENIALTAGHCIESVLSFGGIADVMVSFGEDPITNLNLDDWIDVVDWIQHPDYNWRSASNPHDVGLLILAEQVTDITLATLPEEGFLNDLRAAGELRHGPNKAQFTVVGFGSTLTWPPPVIYFFPHPRQNAQSGFRALLKAWLCLSQNQATDDGGTCFGDSGGPVFWSDGNGDEILVGITSWGDPNCISPSFNYRVDIADTLDFILPILNGEEQ
jgi:secreted trypsin-like serine protease